MFTLGVFGRQEKATPNCVRFIEFVVNLWTWGAKSEGKTSPPLSCETEPFPVTNVYRFRRVGHIALSGKNQQTCCVLAVAVKGRGIGRVWTLNQREYRIARAVDRDL